MTQVSTLTPHLVVRDAPAAIDFYVAAMGARVLERYAAPSGRIVHAALALGDARFTVADEARDWHNDAPTSLGGTPVILWWSVADPDAAAARMVEHGAKVLFPIRDQFYGRREGRVLDPFGHAWVISKPLRDVPADEIQRGVDSFPETPGPRRVDGA